MLAIRTFKQAGDPVRGTAFVAPAQPRVKNPTIRDLAGGAQSAGLREAEAVEPLDAGMMRTVARRTSGSSEVSTDGRLRTVKCSVDFFAQGRVRVADRSSEADEFAGQRPLSATPNGGDNHARTGRIDN